MIDRIAFGAFALDNNLPEMPVAILNLVWAVNPTCGLETEACMVERVPCENCGNTVVATSRLCPHCGSNPNRSRHRWQSLHVKLIVFLFVVGLVGAVAEGVVKGLRDPDSRTSALNEPVPSDYRSDSAIQPVSESETDPSPIDAEVIAERNHPTSIRESTTLTETDTAAASAAETAAIAIALDNGRDEQWSAGGIDGTIEVKSVLGSSDRNCMRYRAIKDGIRSGFSTVCKDPNNAWLPVD